MAEEETKDTEVDENSDDQNTEGENPIWDSIEMGLLQGLVLQAVGLAIGIVLSLIVLPFDILREGLRKVVENLGTSTSHFTPI